MSKMAEEAYLKDKYSDEDYIEWLEGKLDQKNSYILSNGEVKIVDSTINVKNIL